MLYILHNETKAKTSLTEHIHYFKQCDTQVVADTKADPIGGSVLEPVAYRESISQDFTLKWPGERGTDARPS